MSQIPIRGFSSVLMIRAHYGSGIARRVLDPLAAEPVPQARLQRSRQIVVRINQDSETLDGPRLLGQIVTIELMQLAIAPLVFDAKGGQGVLALTDMPQDMQIIRAFDNQKMFRRLPQLAGS